MTSQPLGYMSSSTSNSTGGSEGINLPWTPEAEQNTSATNSAERRADTIKQKAFDNDQLLSAMGNLELKLATHLREGGADPNTQGGTYGNCLQTAHSTNPYR